MPGSGLAKIELTGIDRILGGPAVDEGVLPAGASLNSSLLGAMPTPVITLTVTSAVKDLAPPMLAMVKVSSAIPPGCEVPAAQNQVECISPRLTAPWARKLKALTELLVGEFAVPGGFLHSEIPTIKAKTATTAMALRLLRLLRFAMRCARASLLTSAEFGVISLTLSLSSKSERVKKPSRPNLLLQVPPEVE
jgi:hypothetical protein